MALQPSFFIHFLRACCSVNSPRLIYRTTQSFFLTFGINSLYSGCPATSFSSPGYYLLRLAPPRISSLFQHICAVTGGVGTRIFFWSRDRLQTAILISNILVALFSPRCLAVLNLVMAHRLFFVTQRCVPPRSLLLLCTLSGWSRIGVPRCFKQGTAPETQSPYITHRRPLQLRALPFPLTRG